MSSAMMQVVQSLMGLQHDIDKAVERFAQQLDAKQWPLAGVELGKIAQAARSLENLHALAADILWSESQR